MFRGIMANFRKPEGIVGGLIARMMNRAHGPMTREVVERLGVTAGDAALDIGCGGGGAVALLAGAGARVRGIDHSDVAVGKSRARNREAVRSGRVVIEKGDVRELACEPETFTLVTAFETVYFWDDIGDCFKRIHSVLKPGGRLAVAVAAWKREDGTINCPEFFRRNLEMKFYNVDEFRDLMLAAGFAGIDAWRGTHDDWLCMVATK